MGVSDYFAEGQWNFYCDLCGKKQKSGQGVKTWDNRWVCRHHKEIRNPQDFVRGVKDNQSVPWSRPQPPDQFVLGCSLRTSNAIPGYANPGCAFPSNINLLFIQEGIPQGPWVHSTVVLGIPSYAIPGWAVPGNINRGGNDLSYVFDSMPPMLVRVESTISPGTFFTRIVP